MGSPEQQKYQNFQEKVAREGGEQIQKKVDDILKKNNIDEDAMLQQISREDPSYTDKRYDSFLDDLKLALVDKVGTVQKLQGEQLRIQGVVYNKVKELGNRALMTKSNLTIQKDILSPSELQYYEKIRPIMERGRNTMAMMNALGVLQTQEYKNLDTMMKEDKQLTQEQLASLFQFQENAYLVINAQALLGTLDIIKQSADGITIQKTQTIETKLSTVITKFLSNPLGKADIRNEIVTLKDATDNMLKALQADTRIPLENKSLLKEGLLSMIPGYSTCKILSEKGLDFSTYTMEDMLNMGMDVFSLIPAVKLVSVGLKLASTGVKVANGLNNINKAGKIASLYKTSYVISEIGYLGVSSIMAGKNISEKFNTMTTNGDKKQLIGMCLDAGLIVIGGVYAKSIINTKKCESLGLKKEFIARLGDFIKDGPGEAYLKEWKSVF